MIPTPPLPSQPERRTLRFCQTCNARERVIEHGRCIVCGSDPSYRPLPPVKASWTKLDVYVFVLCVLTTVYVVAHVVAWVVR